MGPILKMKYLCEWITNSPKSIDKDVNKFILLYLRAMFQIFHLGLWSIICFQFCFAFFEYSAKQLFSYLLTFPNTNCCNKYSSIELLIKNQLDMRFGGSLSSFSALFHWFSISLINKQHNFDYYNYMVNIYQFEAVCFYPIC